MVVRDVEPGGVIFGNPTRKKGELVSVSTIDLVVAVRNEEESLPLFVGDVRRLKLPDGIHLGFVFVEDGSTDATVATLRELAKADPSVKYICLKKGYGQGPAVAYGISHSAAEAVITMDVDGGHPVDLIPEMIERYIRGASVVQATRKSLANRSGYRKLGTWFFNCVFVLITGVDTRKQNVFYRLLPTPLAQKLVSDPRIKHFLRIRYSTLPGVTVDFVEFNATERITGHSKYDFRRLCLFAINGVFSCIASSRFIVLVGIGLLLAVVLLGMGFWWVALTLLAITAWACRKMWVMTRNDIFDSIEVIESSIDVR
jgi:glycosyltransferase involved in cell wall biosynthesis